MKKTVKTCAMPMLSGAAIFLLVFVTACATSPSGGVSTTNVSAANADDLLVVDCLLPGQVRRLGAQATFLTARRAIKTSAVDCEIRGGEYVSYDRADYRTALKVWLPLAEEGDPQAQTYVGEIFEKGLGTIPDYMVAAAWYQRAAEQGYSRAQINLGYLYEKGLGVEADGVEALNWYRRASGIVDDDLQYASVHQARHDEAQQEIQALRGEVTKLSGEAESLQAQRRQVQNELNRRDQSLAEARQELERVQQQLEENRTAAASAPVDANLVALEQSLRARFAEADRERAETLRLEQELARKNQALEQELARKNQALEAQASRSEDLQRALLERERDLELMRQQVANSQFHFERSQRQIADLNRDLDRINGQLETTRAQSETLSAEQLQRQAVLTQQLRQREAELERQRQESARLNADIRQFQARIERAEKTQAEAVGPKIEIIDPLMVVTRGTAPRATLSAPMNERVVVGKITAPAGLVSLAVNDRDESWLDSGMFSVSVPLAGAETPVNIVAIDRQGRRVVTEFVIVSSLRRDAEPARTAPAVAPRQQARSSVAFGNYYALIIGNDRYGQLSDLDSAIRDAEYAEELMRVKYGFKTTLLRNATRYDLLSELNKLRERLTDKDNLLIYYAGHGELDQVNLRGYWLPVDAEPNNTANWVSNQDITDILNAMSAKHILVVADSCYSGTMSRASVAALDTAMSSEARERWLRVMAKTRSRTVLTSGGLVPVLDSGAGEHSVFARAFFDVLEGNQGVLEAYQVYVNLADQVARSAAKFNVEQVPQYAPIQHGGHEAGEFFFVPVSARL